jgi:hypothetical protein
MALTQVAQMLAFNPFTKKLPNAFDFGTPQKEQEISGAGVFSPASNSIISAVIVLIFFLVIPAIKERFVIP